MPGRHGLEDTDDFEPVSRAPPKRYQGGAREKGRSHIHFVPDSAKQGHQDESQDMDKKLPPMTSTAGSQRSHAKYVPASHTRITSPDADVEAKRAAAGSSAASPSGALGVAAIADETTQKKGSLDRYLNQPSAAQPKKAHRSSASTATPRVSNVSGSSKPRRKEDNQGEATIGAIAVRGMESPACLSAPGISGYSNDGTDMYNQSVGSKPEPIQEEEEVPLEATLVPEGVDEADVEAQVQERMRNEASNIADMIQERIFQNTVVAEVQPADQGSAASTADSEQEIKSAYRRKICILLVLVVLIIAGAVGAGVGVASSKKSPSTTTDPTPTPPVTSTPPTTTPAQPGETCSLCYDGTIPSGLDTNTVSDDQTCAEYREDVIKLSPSDPGCQVAQSWAWGLCECPTLPPPPADPACTMCPDGEPPRSDPAICQELDTFIRHVGSDPSISCDDLAGIAPEFGCECPTDNTAAFRDVLVSISGDTLDDPSTPQYQALNWIANEDPAGTTLADTNVVKQRYVAAVLYFALGGEGWTKQYNFLSADDICDWNENSWMGLVCSSNDNVIAFRLVDNGLLGMIPEEIGYFSSLGTIVLEDDAISGTLPSSLSELKLLSELDLSNNALSGAIPDFLYTHARLNELNLNENGFTGTINPSLGTSPRLETFWVYDNKLTGSIPDAIGQSAVLKSFDIGKNSLQGTIPEFSLSSPIEDLSLGSNDLVGTIPNSLGSVSSLQWLALSINGMTGTIPVFSGNQGSLQYLGLSANRLTGDVSRLFTTTPPNSLEDLDLDGNLLSGTLPSEIGQFTALTSLRLLDNNIRGTIPTEVGMLTALTTDFLLNDNELTGTIPSEIGQFTMLGSHLQLHANRLNGTLPITLGNLVALENVFLFDNQLTGSIPTELGGCTSLQILNFAENQLNGDIGPVIDALPRSLVRLDLDTNRLGGMIPTSVATFTNLNSLDLHINDIGGTIPSEFGVLTKLTILALSTNQLSGTVPSSLASLTNLSLLLLHENNLSGSVDFLCENNIESFTADNTCAAPSEIECTCCTHCCNADLSICTETEI